MDRIIAELTKVGKDYFGNSFHFNQSTYFFIAKSDFMSSAINNRKNDAQKINAINWFDDLWLFIEIKFIQKVSKKRIIPNIFFSLSVFQGEISDEKKLQLFRADWDNYDESNDKHPQPHWHIYSKKDDVIAENFNEEIEQAENPFNEFIEDGRNKVLNTDRFHFAMNGQWSDNNTDVHSISVDSDLINWFKGLLNHLKKELEYVKEK
ncbi:MAG: hypothetical protein U9P73_04585 [Candidatus Cloacimonadota bacterium]|nr:hypothetical protein [Candidatus Cloacimonadota bacterium]